MSILKESLIQFNNDIEFLISEFSMKSEQELRNELEDLRNRFNEISLVRPVGRENLDQYELCKCPKCHQLHKKLNK